ncbi:LOW QUALITY PROTEIN: hypothetical protein Cgig2_017627 [Carnegiea gigantea]|uniref:Uncharacterized protein n=1 Tax=Carnegiea gigantea TaxID=171969 RepID=A0A9Q1Q489_9CARY|nr:LOW QUALITY PROTEIN: hypothetical protein Cgig2_017627 [Carnegiea gigantea]
MGMAIQKATYKEADFTQGHLRDDDENTDKEAWSSQRLVGCERRARRMVLNMTEKKHEEGYESLSNPFFITTPIKHNYKPYPKAKKQKVVHFGWDNKGDYIISIKVVETETRDEYEATGENLLSKFINDVAMKEKNLQSAQKEIEIISDDRRNLLGKFINYDTMKKNRATKGKLLNTFISYNAMKKNRAMGRHMLKRFDSYFKEKNIALPIGRKLLNKFISYDAIKKNKAVGKPWECRGKAPVE